MKPKTDNLLTIIEALPIDAKAALVETILASMHPLQQENDEQWKIIAGERIANIKVGNVQVISGDEVFRDIKEKYNI